MRKLQLIIFLLNQELHGWMSLLHFLILIFVGVFLLHISKYLLDNFIDFCFVNLSRNLTSIDISSNKITTAGMYVLTEGFRAGEPFLFYFISFEIDSKNYEYLYRRQDFL